MDKGRTTDFATEVQSSNPDYQGPPMWRANELHKSINRCDTFQIKLLPQAKTYPMEEHHTYLHHDRPPLQTSLFAVLKDCHLQ